MRAVTYTTYGGPEVLHLEQVEQPSPTADELLVKVHATTVNRTDCGIRSAKPFITRVFSGLRAPKRHILGTEFAGVVESVGASVTNFAAGDRVFGVNANGMGAHAEFMCIKETGPVATMPSGMAFDEAAAVGDGMVLAVTFLRRVGLGAGQRILVYGASGSIGTAGVQLAKHFGAHVTAVARADHFELLRSLGADEVIDYEQTDFTTTGATYDYVFDAVGKLRFRHSKQALVQGGAFMTTDLGYLWQNPWWALLARPLKRFNDGKWVAFPLPAYTKEKVLFLKGLIEAGEYRAVIDRRYPLEDVIAATTYVETQQKVGNVVLMVSPD